MSYFYRGLWIQASGMCKSHSVFLHDFSFFTENNFRHFRILLAKFSRAKLFDESYFIFSISNPWEVKAMKRLLHMK